MEGRPRTRRLADLAIDIGMLATDAPSTRLMSFNSLLRRSRPSHFKPRVDSCAARGRGETGGTLSTNGHQKEKPADMYACWVEAVE